MAPQRFRSLFLRTQLTLGLFAVLIAGCFIAGASHALAAATVAPLVSYQARLMDPSGFPVSDGTYSVQFSIYDAATAGNRLWTAAGTLGAPTAISVSVQNGLFSVLLGDTGQNTLDTVDWNQDNLYIGVTISADAEMTPRRRLAAVPQAFNARQLQGMYASSTAFGASSLFTVNQTSNTSATGTRTALEIRSSGTNSSNDFLIRGVNDLANTVFSVNRQGSVTTTGDLAVMGVASTTNLFVAGQLVCLANGTNCAAGSAAQTLAEVTARGSFATSTLQLYGGFVGSSSTVTSTLTVLGQGIFSALTVTGTTALGNLTFTNGTGINVTTTNLFASGIVSTTQLFVTGQLVCLASGSNCPASGSGTTTQWWVYNNASDFLRVTTPTTDIVLGANATSTGAPAFFDLAGETNGTSNFYFGHATNANILLGGTSTTQTGLNSLFTLNGNDLFVQGNIGSASSVYTNGAFVAGSGTTYFGDGFINKRGAGALRITASSTRVIGNIDATLDAVTEFRRVDSGTISGFSNDYAVAAGDYLYVTENSGTPDGLQIYSVANPDTIVALGRQGYLSQDPTELVVQGDYAYTILSQTSQLSVVNVSNPSRPFVVATTTNPAFNTPSDIKISGKYLYISSLSAGAGNGNTVILDISDPANATTVSTILGLSLPNNVEVSGKYLFIQENLLALRSIRAYDISDPRSPVFVGAVSTTVQINDMVVQGSVLHLMGATYETINISNPAAMVSMDTLAINNGSTSPSLEVSGRYAIAPGGSLGVIDILDVSNPSDLRLVQTLDTSGSNPAGIALNGNRLYVFDGGLTEYDIFELPGVETGGFKAAAADLGSLQVSTDAVISGILNIGGGLSIGKGGLFSEGSLSIYATNTTSTFSGAVSTTNLFVRGRAVCLIDGSNCPASAPAIEADTLSSVSSRGNFATSTLVLYGGFVGSSSTVTSTFTVLGSTSLQNVTGANATFTNATASNLLVTGQTSTTQLNANSGTFGSLTVAGQLVCLANGTNCTSSGGSDTNWAFISTVGAIRVSTTTNDVIIGSSATSSGAPAYFDISGNGSNFYFGHNTNTNLVIGGTSTTQTGLNSLFALNGNDLFVSGNIGSASSIYTNGAFVAGPASTVYADGSIVKRDGNFAISASGTGAFRGDISLIGSHSQSGAAGEIFISAGSSTGIGAGGNITLSPGFGVGQIGHIYIDSYSSSEATELRFRTPGGNPFNWVSLRAPDVDGTQRSFILPWEDGASSTVLATNGVGQFTFASVCLTDGTNCPAASGSGTTTQWWVYNNTSDFLRVTTPTTDIVLGSNATSTGAPAYFNLAGGTTGSSTFFFGFNTSSNVVIGGTSNTVAFMNQNFALNGNDLYVAGSIGSASTVFTNSEFVVNLVGDPLFSDGNNLGPGPTRYGNGYIVNTAGAILIRGTADENSASPGGVMLRAGDGLPLLPGGSEITISAGNGLGDGTGGSVSITAGFSGTTTASFGGNIAIGGGGGQDEGNAGSALLAGGDAVFGTGGNATIRGGDALTGNFAGSVYLQPGTATAPNDTSASATFIMIQGSSSHAGSPPTLRFRELSSLGSEYVGFRSATSLEANTVWVLPTSNGASGTALLTNSSRELYFGAVCLANGTNCPASGSGTTTQWWVYNNASDFLRVTTPTTDIVLGSEATSTGAAAYFDLAGATRGTSTFYFGHATNANIVLGGTSTTQTGLNSLFQINGNDLFVHGNIGSVSSVYTNGAFVAGLGSTYYASGTISQTVGNLIFNIAGGSLLPNTDLGISLGNSSTRFNAYFGDVTSTNVTTTNLFANTIRAGSVSSSLYTMSLAIPVAMSTHTTAGTVTDVYVNGKYAYITEAANAFFSIVDIADPRTPSSTSRTSSGGGNIGTMRVVGNYAYVANQSSDQLRIYDIRNKKSPQLIGTATEGAEDMDLQGGYAYMLDVDEFSIIDVSNPSGPRVLSNFATSTGEHVRVYGRYAYLSLGAQGLAIIDVNNPTAPTSTGFFNPSGNVSDVILSGKYAYVAAGNDGVYILDVGNPAAPIQVGQFNPAGVVLRLFLAGNYLYAAAGDLEVYDVSSSTNPVPARSFSTAGTVDDVFVSGRYAYLVANNALMTVDLGGLDVSTANIGSLAGQYINISDNANIGNDLTVNGGLMVGEGGILSLGPLFISATNTTSVIMGGVSTTHILADGNLTVKGSVTTTAATFSPSSITAIGGLVFNSTQEIQVRGHYAFVTAQALGHYPIVDISSPSAPTSVASINPAGGNVGGLALAGKYIYVSSDSIFEIHDISNPIEPALVGSGTASGTAHDLVSNGNYVYQLTSAHLKTWDVTDPTQPRIVNFVTTSTGGGGKLFLQGNYLYSGTLADQNFRVYDITNPVSPTFVGGLTPSGGDVEGLYVSGRYAYLADDTDDLVIVDLINPAAPVEISNLDFNISASTIYVSGKYAYLAGTTNLFVFDISSSTRPIRVATHTLANNSTEGLFVAGRYAYIGSSSAVANSFVVLDLKGVDTYVANIGDLQAGNVTVQDHITVGQSIDIGDYLSVGMGGLLSAGALNVTATGTTSTILGGVSTTRLSVGGFNVCLANGTNCPASFSADLNWSYSPTTDSVRNTTSTTDIFLGSTATSTGAPAYFDLSGGTNGTSTFYFGHATNANLVIGGTSTTQTGLNAQFHLDGDDLFVHGNIGSVSSVYTNGAFVAGAGSTYFGNGFINKNDGLLTVRGSSGLSLDAGGSALTLGTTSDFLTINARLSSSILPTSNNSVSLGNNLIAFSGLFAVNVSSSNVTTTNFATTNLSSLNYTNLITGDRIITAVSSVTLYGSNPQKVVARNKSAYIINDGPEDVLQIINASNPASPTTTGIGALQDGAAQIELQGESAFIVNTSTGFITVKDMKIPGFLSFGGQQLSVPSVRDLKPRGKYLYAGTSAAGRDLVIYDIGGASIREVASDDFGGAWIGNMDLDSHYLYYCSGISTCRVIDISNPADLQQVGDFIPESYIDLIANNGFLYALGGLSNPNALNIYDFVGQRTVTTTDLGGGASTMVMSGNYLFMASSSKIFVVDIHTPANPVRYTLQSSNAADNFKHMAVEGTILYALDSTSNSLRIFDLGGMKTTGIDAASAWFGDLSVGANANVLGSLDARGGLNVGINGIHSRGGINVDGDSASPTAIFVNSEYDTFGVSGTAWGVYTNSLLVGSDRNSTGTTNYRAVIQYAGASVWGGLCIDDISNDSDMCPTSGIGSASILADGAITADAFDLAEVYAVNGTSTPGDLVVIDSSVTSTPTVKLSEGTPYDSKVIGIVSTDPGFVLGWNQGAKVALTGRVPTKVAMTNGPIQIGDALTSSDVPGYAMKATKPGMVVGYALGELNATGTVETFVSVGYWAGSLLSTDGITARITDNLVIGATSTANALNPTADSWGLTFRGSAWNAASSTAVSHDFVFMNDTISATNSLLTIRNTTNTAIFTLSQDGNLSLSGDVALAGRLYPSARGLLQDDYFIFVDDSSSTNQYISTNADGWTAQNSYDLAERYLSTQDLEAGDVVMAGSQPVTVAKTNGASSIPMGIVSSKPGFLLGRNTTGTFPIALAGRVPTKVSNVNGAIAIGDELIPSEIPGVAAKSDGTGRVVGIALEAYDMGEVGRIEVFVKSGGLASSVTVQQNVSGPSSLEAPVMRSGLALIESGRKRVHVSYDSIGAWPKVLATSLGEVEGGWWTEGYSDLGFDLIMKQEQPRDITFTWEVKPVINGDRIFRSDGLNSIMNTTTGQPEGGWSGQEEEAPTSTEPIPEEPVTTSTEPTPPTPEPPAPEPETPPVTEPIPEETPSSTTP